MNNITKIKNPKIPLDGHLLKSEYLGSSDISKDLSNEEISILKKKAKLLKKEFNIWIILK